MDSRSQSAFLRQHLLVDSSVQGPLLRRIAFYSLACGLYFMMALVITESLSNPHEAVSETTRRCLDEAAFWAPGFMLLTPIIIYDLLGISNRFAGPIFRLRHQMRDLAKGKPTAPLTFREGDYWQEVADSFNQIRRELLELRELQSQLLGDARIRESGPVSGTRVDNSSRESSLAATRS